MTQPLEEIENSLRQIQLPVLARPKLGPDDPPTLQLAQFDLNAYAYSSVAYVRNLLDGFLVLADAQNVAAVDLVVRGLYEWTMQASYVDQMAREPMAKNNYTELRAIMDRIQTGNGWARRHGDKYWKPPFDDYIPDSLRIKHLVKAYKAHQLETHKVETVEDDYGYLSEHAHPNSVCFLDVTRSSGWILEFVEPTPGHRNLGIATATMLDWSLCIYNILGLAGEQPVRREFVKMLESVVLKHKHESGALG